MEEQLTNHLLAQAGLTALVGDRITWSRRAQGAALPAVVLNIISRTPGYSMEAVSGAVEQRVQVDCWGATYGDARGVARQITESLSGVRVTVAGVNFLGSFKDGDRDSFEQGAGDEPLYRVNLDFIIWTRED